MLIIKPCILYKLKLLTGKMQKTKLEKVANGTLGKQETLVFSAPSGVEGLLHVIDLFLKAADRLNFVITEK